MTPQDERIKELEAKLAESSAMNSELAAMVKQEAREVDEWENKLSEAQEENERVFKVQRGMHNALKQTAKEALAKLAESERLLGIAVGALENVASSDSGDGVDEFAEDIRVARKALASIKALKATQATEGKE